MFPAASVALTIRTCTPGARSGSDSVICSRSESKIPSSGNIGVQRAAVEGVFGLDDPRELVGQGDPGASSLRLKPDVRRVVIHEEAQALALARQGVVGAV